MGTENISRTRALRSGSRFRPRLLFRRCWFVLTAASVLGCTLYLLFTSAPLTFAAQDPVQTQLSAGPATTMAPAMGSAPPPPPPVMREQRLSTVFSEDMGHPGPTPSPTTEESFAKPPLAQEVPAEQATSAPEPESTGPIEHDGNPPPAALPATTIPLATTDNAQTVDEAAATTTPNVLSTAEATGTPPPTDKTVTTPMAGTATAPSPASTAKAAPAKETRRLFGTVEMRASIRDLRQWQDVQKRHADNPIFTSGFKLNASTSWDKLKSMLNDKPPLEKLRGVNSFWNQWPYKLDIAGYGKEDYWAAPYEFRKNSGDCEDYAIVKYYTLKELGIPVEQMRIVVLKDTILNVAHAILAVYLEDDIYILDNIAKNVLSHTRIRNYLPVYSVNEQYRWVHVRTK